MQRNGAGLHTASSCYWDNTSDGMHMHVYLCMYVYVCVFVCVYMCVFVCAYICTRVCTCVYLYVRTCVHMYAFGGTLQPVGFSG